MTDPLVAIFVGGRSSRMGVDKGLLAAPGGGTLLESLASAAERAKLPAALIGNAAPYASLAVELPRLSDRPEGSGPLGGLGGAFAFARSEGHQRIIAVACDMPYVHASVLRTIAEYQSVAPVLAPRRDVDSPWEPMLARYDIETVSSVLDAVLRSGKRSFQALFGQLNVEELPLSDDVLRALSDWDTPADVPG